MNEPNNGPARFQSTYVRLPNSPRDSNTMPRAISRATWDQIKIARAAGASYGEVAKRTGISRGTILAHAHRKGWTKDIALARPKGDNTPQASQRRRRNHCRAV